MANNLRQIAAEIRDSLHANGFPAEEAATRQMLALAEECGEFTGAYRRWSGQARRTGTFADVAAELADVVIVSWVTAAELGVDLPETTPDPEDSPMGWANREVLALAGHAGAVAMAFQRWDDLGRDSADLRAELAGTLEDLVAVAWSIAVELGVDLDAAVTAKLAVIRSRGWRDPKACGCSAGHHCGQCIDTDPAYRAHVASCTEARPLPGCPYCPDDADRGR